MSILDEYFGIFKERGNDQVMRKRAMDVADAILVGLRTPKASSFEPTVGEDIGVSLDLSEFLKDKSLENLELMFSVGSKSNKKSSARGERAAGFRTYSSGRRQIEIVVDIPPEAARLVTKTNWPAVVAKQGAKIFERSKEFFVHEFIHYLDWLRIHPDKRRAVFGKDKTSPEKYFNDPLETNAYLQQGLSRVDNHLKGMRNRAEAQNLIGKSPDEFYRIMLKVLNSGIGKYMNDQNKKKLKKRLASMWSDTMERFDQ